MAEATKITLVAIGYGQLLIFFFANHDPMSIPRALTINLLGGLLLFILVYASTKIAARRD